MNNHSSSRAKKRIFSGKGMLFGKMRLVTPHISRFLPGMDIMSHSTADTEADNDE